MTITPQELQRLLRDDWNALGTQAAMEELYTILSGGNVAGTKSSNRIISNAKAGATGTTGTTGQSGSAGAASPTDLGNAIVVPGQGNGPNLTLTDVTPSDGSTGFPALSIQFGNDTTGDIFLGPFGLTFSVGGISLDFPTTQTVPVVGDQIQLYSLPAAYPCIIQSGSGIEYQITIYPNGLDQPGQTVPAKSIVALDPDDEIPAGTAGLAVRCGFDVKKGPKYYFNVPVWL